MSKIYHGYCTHSGLKVFCESKYDSEQKGSVVTLTAENEGTIEKKHQAFHADNFQELRFQRDIYFDGEFFELCRDTSLVQKAEIARSTKAMFITFGDL